MGGDSMNTEKQLPERALYSAENALVIDRLLHKRIFQGLLRGDASYEKELSVVYGRKDFSDINDEKYHLYLKSPYFALLKIVEIGAEQNNHNDMFGWGRSEYATRLDTLIHDIYEEALDFLGDAYHLEVDGHECVLMNFTEFDESDIEVSSEYKTSLIRYCAEQAAFTLATDYHIQVAVAITSVCKTAEKIQRLYREVKRLSEYQQVLDYRERFITYFDVHNRALSLAQKNRQKELERKYLMAVMSFEYSVAKEYLVELLDCCSEDRFSAVAGLQMKLMNHINYALGSQFFDLYTTETDAYHIIDTAHQLQDTRSLGTTKELITVLFDSLEQYRIDHYLSDNARAINVVRYIESNYSNPNLDVTMICDENHISQQYLTKLLKQHTGRGTLENIHYIRIQEAKRQLETTDDSITVISDRIGYTNQWTFFRSFKKLEGITPGEYREVQTKDKK